MTFSTIIQIVLILIGAALNVRCAYWLRKKHREVNEYREALDEAFDALLKTAAEITPVMRQQPELFITADSEDASKEVTLKLSLDEIDIDKVKDRATRNFLLKRKLMMSFCPN